MGDNIKMNLKDIRYKGVDWVDVAQEMVQRRAHVNAVIYATMF
jgi:hypothetical protein